MRRNLLLGLLLLVAACGDAGAPEAAPVAVATLPPADRGDTTTSAADRQPDPAAAPAPTAAAPPVATGFEGPPAPDFTLALENQAGTFVLSEAAAPVYLTFWAEW